MNLGAKGFYKTLTGLVLVFLMLLVYAAAAQAELFMSISGTVKDASTGKGIGGLKMMAFSKRDIKFLYAETDNNGNYVIKMVPEGDYTVYANPPRNYIISSYKQDVKVEKGKNVVGLNFGLSLGGTVSGTIYHSDGVTPLANAQIFALTYKGASMAKTDELGQYSLAGLVPEASAKLRIYIYSYGMILKENINIVAGQVTSNINFNLLNEATGLTGIVSTNNSAGTAISDASVILYNDKNLGITRTDANGRFHIKGLPEGVYQARVYKLRYGTKLIGNILITGDQTAIKNFSLNEEPLPIPISTSFNEKEANNILTLSFTVDNPESPYVTVSYGDNGTILGCTCHMGVSYSFVWPIENLPYGVPKEDDLIPSYTISIIPCVCLQQCGNDYCTSLRVFKSFCKCTGIGVSVDVIPGLHCIGDPRGKSDNLTIGGGPASVTFAYGFDKEANLKSLCVGSQTGIGLPITMMDCSCETIDIIENLFGGKSIF